MNGVGSHLFKTIAGLEPLDDGRLKELARPVKISYVDQNREDIDPEGLGVGLTVWTTFRSAR